MVGSVAGPAHAVTPAPATAYVLTDPLGEPGLLEADSGSWAVTTTQAGGVTTAYTRAVDLEPPTGGRFGVGRVALTPGGSPDEPSVRYEWRLCRSTNATSGYVDVREASYDADGTLQSLAADLSLNCGTSAPTVQLRYNSAVPRAAASSMVTTADTLVDQPVEVTTTFRNTGTVTLHPSTPQVGQGQHPVEVTGETCSQAALEPGQTCSVTVSTYGNVLVSVPVPEVDDLAQADAPVPPALVGDIRVTAWPRPGHVTNVRTWPGTDGVGVSWTGSEPYASYYKVERSTADGPWEVVASQFSGGRLGDTAAPAGQPSVYRITPASEGGYDQGGSAESAAATPLPAWSPPPGAQTYASVDGAGQRPASAVIASDGRIEVRGDFQHPGLSLGPVLWRAWSTPTTVRLDANTDGWGNACWYAAGGGGCEPITGSLTVQRVALQADGTPEELTATVDGTHPTAGGATAPVHAIVVLNSVPTGLAPYLVTAPELVTAQVSLGSDQSFPLTLRNIGGSAGTPTTVTTQSEYYVPVQPSAWTVPATCVGRPLAAGAQCVTSARIDATGVPSTIGPLTGVTTFGMANGQAAVAHLSGRWRDVRVAPAATLSVPPITRASTSVTLTSSDPQAGDTVTLHCRLDGGPFVTCGPTWSLSGLANGSHVVVAYATDQDDNMSDWVHASFRVDTQGPVTRMVSPAAGEPVVLGPTAWVSWDATDVVGVSSLQARVRSATPSSAMGAAAVPRCCTALRSNGVSPTLAPGAEQCWSARAVDLFGEWGPWSSERCAVRPLDDRWMTSRGFELESSYSYGYWWHTATRTGATLSLNGVRGRQVGLLVSVCPTCGAVDVYVGGVYQGRVSLVASRSRSQVVLWLPRQAVERRGTLVIRTTSARRVVMDGVLVRHL